MKNYNIVLLVIVQLCVTLNVFADDTKFIETMKKNIDLVYTSESIEQLQSVANTFQRIGEAEKIRWEPFYYEAFAYVMMANRETDKSKKDMYLDEALKAVEQCKTVFTDSEIIAMEGFIHMIRVTVDPATRGPQFAPLSVQFFKKALEQNPNNPRALAMLAQMQYGTAQFFGLSTEEACTTAKMALEKFNTFQTENPIAPVWGKMMVESLLPACQ